MSYTSLNDKQEGYKLPKDCIRYDLAAKDRLNLSEMTCTVIYEGAHEQRHQLKVVGELLSDDLTEDALIYVTVYDETGTLVGCDFSVAISKSGFWGLMPFSTAVFVPKDTVLSEVVIRHDADPSKTR